MSTRFRGIAASNGIAIARALVLKDTTPEVVERHDVVVDTELDRVQTAIAASKADLNRLYDTTKQKLGESHAQIFKAHMLILDDPEFVDSIKSFITGNQVNAEFALQNVSDQLIGIFESMADDYMRQRAADIRDLSQRVLSHLQGRAGSLVDQLQEPVILVVDDLAPSDTVNLDQRFVKAFITKIGGRTSHSAIMARSLGIPAVVGVGDGKETIVDGTSVIVNGTDGEVIVDPTEEELQTYESLATRHLEYMAELKTLTTEKSTTRDGHTIELAANIGRPNDLQAVLENGAEGIGLFRSEFLFMNRKEMPSEEEQFEAYKTVVEGMSERPAIIRTLDVGGDKEIPYLDLPKEANPFLGYRAIRVCLNQTDLFKVQLRAILRASHFGNTKIMFPMIATVTEVRQAKQILDEVRAELDAARIPYSKTVEVGIMVEIPASAIAADILAKEVDFFSIGTNDLIQYTMACDRMNESISYLYQPHHPAILRLVKMVIDAAHREGKWAGMCGEMAGDAVAVPILIGLGLDEFSMSAGSILPTRKLIRELSYESLQRVAEEALRQESQEAVREFMAKTLHSL